MKEDWIECTFKELTLSLKRGPFGGDLKKSFFVESGFPVYEQQHAINDDYSNIRYFIDDERFEKLKACNVGPGDYIVSCSGTMGKISRIPNNVPKGVINQALLRIRLNDEIMLHNYFIQYFKSSLFQKKILKDSRGSGMQNMAGIKELKPIPISIPPLVEQKAIVKKIEALFSSLDSGIADLKKAQDQLKIYRQAVLKKAFEGEYEIKKLGEVAEVKRGKSKHRPRNDKSLFGGKYPFIQTGEIRATNGGVITKYSNTYSKKGLAQSKLWPKGTLCLTIAANIGETAFLGFDACFPDSVVGIIPNDEFLNSKFLNFYIQKIKEEMDSKASATAQKNINVRILDALEVPIPTLKEQHQIVSDIESRLSVCDKVEKDLTDSLEKAQALRQSILKKAFEGKLLNEDEITACKADAAYEPASILLEKIKAEKKK